MQWYLWVTSPRPETLDIPPIPAAGDDENRRAHMGPAERLVVLAILRPDRLNPGLDGLIESVLGVSFLQTSSGILTSEETPWSVLVDIAKLSVDNVQPPAILLQTAAGDPIQCLRQLAEAAKQSRASLLVRDISVSAASTAGTSSPATPSFNSAPETDSKLQQSLAKLRAEVREVAGVAQNQQVWLVIKCFPLSPSSAEFISSIVTDMQKTSTPSSPFASAKDTNPSAGAASKSSLGASASLRGTHATSYIASHQGAEAFGADASPASSGKKLIWIMIDDFELLSLQNLCTCPRIRACNILGRCLGGGGGVPLISVSHIAAELFSQLMDTEWRQDSEGAASQGESWRAMV